MTTKTNELDRALEFSSAVSRQMASQAQIARAMIELASALTLLTQTILKHEGLPAPQAAPGDVVAQLTPRWPSLAEVVGQAPEPPQAATEPSRETREVEVRAHSRTIALVPTATAEAPTKPQPPKPERISKRELAPLAQRLRQALAGGKTQVEVAAAVGVTSRAVGYWAAETYRPTRDHAAALGQWLDGKVKEEERNLVLEMLGGSNG